MESEYGSQNMTTYPTTLPSLCLTLKNLSFTLIMMLTKVLQMIFVFCEFQLFRNKSWDFIIFFLNFYLLDLLFWSSLVEFIISLQSRLAVIIATEPFVFHQKMLLLHMEKPALLLAGVKLSQIMEDIRVMENIFSTNLKFFKKYR